MTHVGAGRTGEACDGHADAPVDGQRVAHVHWPVDEVAARRDQGHVDSLAGERLQREACLEAGDAAAEHEHAHRDVTESARRPHAATARPGSAPVMAATTSSRAVARRSNVATLRPRRRTEIRSAT